MASIEPIEPREIGTFPSFSSITPATWRALERCVTDPETVERVWQVMAANRALHQAVAAAHIAEALRGDSELATKAVGADPDHLAELLVALVTAALT